MRPGKHVFCVYCTAKPLDTIVLVSNDLNIFNDGSGTFCSQSQTVDLVVLPDRHPTMAHGDMLQGIRLIVGDIPPILSKWLIGGNTFNLSGLSVSTHGYRSSA